LRLQSPTQWVLRTTIKDVEMGGVRIPAGSRVCLLWGSANRDAERFGEGADRFDLDRTDAPSHFAFGYGSHFCAGAVLARMELTIALEAMLARLKNPRLDGADAVQFGNHPILLGARKVKVVFDPV
jgi:cytochrome P450